MVNYIWMACCIGLFFNTKKEWATSTPPLYKTIEGTIRFFSETPLENIDAFSENMASAINPTNKNVAVAVNIKSFQFKNGLMKDHFNEKYLESDKYPKATFLGSIKEDIDFTKPGTYPVTVVGKLTIHGVDQDRTIPCTLTISPSKKITLHTTFNVKLADHRIEIPTLVIQQIAETIAITCDATYQ